MNPFRIFLACVALSGFGDAGGKSRVLILSGANNHDWKSTTPAIRAALEETGHFEVDVEENVIAMKPEAFGPYAVVLSNFNTYGKDAPANKDWPLETQQAFLAHMAKGNGLVIVHAGSSVFYDWTEFQNLACGTWRNGTHHGRIHLNQVTFADTASPITQGLKPFWIRDEFWQRIQVAPGAKPLASVIPDPAFEGSGKPESIIFSTESGGGRGFAIFLGHDSIAMKNTAFKTLLQRGTEWAATAKVTIPPAKDWPATKDDALRMGFSWKRTDTTLTLSNGIHVIWSLVFDRAQPKSYFHPLATVDGNILSGFEPRDHPWHRGLWWSWKYINGINYWEEDRTTRASEGITELTGVDVKEQGDFGARAELRFSFHPPNQPVVMTEKRNLVIGPPDLEGSYVIDWTSEFTAGDGVVKLDRTPPPNHGGPAYGGYGGLSMRFPPASKGFSFHSSEGKAGGHGKPARWFNLSGPHGGIAILDHPGNLRHPSPWYLSEKPDMLFFGPAPLFNEAFELAPRQTITFSYRVIVHSKPLTKEHLNDQWRSFSGPKP
jgi:type 1 glutamine amidotransferase